jgi:ribose 5-phosphate isomerase A
MFAAMDPKARAAQAALSFLKSGMVVGVGTGTTSDAFMQALARELRSGRLTNIRGVPTSRRSQQRAAELGIGLVSLRQCPRPDVTVDGADEIAPNLDLIKGLGGALLREKVIAQASAQLIIIADSSKAVDRLGTRSPLPVEVVPFEHECHDEFFRSLGAVPVLRRAPDGSPFVTDNGNYIYDCRFAAIDDPVRIEDRVLHRAGVVDCGLFLGMARVALIADERGVRELRR